MRGKCDQAAARGLPAVLLVLGGALVTAQVLPSSTFQKVELAMEPHYEGLCVPTVTEVNLQWGVSGRILCFLLCRQRSNCTFFTSAGSVCKLWSFTLDESYHLGNFSPPLTPSYWPKVRIPPPPTDLALGKISSSGGKYWIFRQGEVLTYGSRCWPNAWDCMATDTVQNWAKVDLERAWPVTLIVLTGPAGAARPYFVDITIRAGQYGNRSDAYVGITPSTAPTVQNLKLSYPVPANVPPFRYIYLENEKTNKEISLCKVQAFL